MSSNSNHKPLSDFTIRPVGIIKNTLKKPFLVASNDGIEMSEPVEAVKAKIRESHNMKSKIIIRKELTAILDGIEGYSHLMVLYWAHKVPKNSRSLIRVHPMGRKENPLMGIFSTFSPARPNPVLMTLVRLYTRKENILEVTGMDAVDGSPVIDIKPYVSAWYPQDDIRMPDWMQRMLEEADSPEDGVDLSRDVL